MISRQATVAAPEGLHARPAAEFVQAVRATGLPVMISTAGRPPVPATSILSVLTLGVKQGGTVVLSIADDHDGAPAALAGLVQVLEEPAQ
ncbi:MAG: HPr family phosphocarrier protein [Brooklawnia sp.]|jgi:phosphocarrier protein HPr